MIQIQIEEDAHEVFALLLRKLRESSRFTQREVRCRTGISRQYLSRYEHGRSIPDDGNLLKLANVYNVSFELLKKNRDTSRLSRTISRELK